MKNIAMVLIMFSTLSASCEALEYRCEVDGWNMNNCGWIIVKF